MKPLSQPERQASSPSFVRSRVAIALSCLALGGGGGFALGQGCQGTVFRESVTDRGNDVKPMPSRAEVEDLREKLRRTERSNRHYESWFKLMMRQLRAESEAMEEAGEEGDLSSQCRALRLKERRSEAEKMIQNLGITNEADRATLIDAYENGCQVSGVGPDGYLHLQDEDPPVCHLYEFQESSGRNFIDPERYEDASAADTLAMERYQDGDYEGALTAVQDSLSEAEAIASQNPLITGLPVYEPFRDGIRAVYDEFASGHSMKGYCMIGQLIEQAGGIEEEFGDDPAFLALLADQQSKQDLEALMGKVEILGDIIDAIVQRDFPEYFGTVGASFTPEFAEECNRQGFTEVRTDEGSQ